MSSRDRRMMINHLLHSDKKSAPITSATPQATATISTLPSHQEQTSVELSAQKQQIVNARREFASAIMKPSPKSGYLKCRLCDSEVWGPNGRYHLDKCNVLKEAKYMTKLHNVRLTSIAGINIHSDTILFKSTKKQRPPKPPKIPGFVIDSDEDDEANIILDDKERVVKRKKGYLRCIKCNNQVYAPNARYHAHHCARNTLY